MNKPIKKFLAISMASIMTISVASIALVANASETFDYKGIKATAALDTKFGWNFFNSPDEAKATTKFDKSHKGYRVASRIECWTAKDKMSGYKYDCDSKTAEVNYNWSNVYCYQSRHSIDNSNNTKEFVVKSYVNKE